MPIRAKVVRPINIEYELKRLIEHPRLKDLFIDRVEEIRDMHQAANNAFADMVVPVETFVNGQPATVDRLTVPGNVTFVWRWIIPVVLQAKTVLEEISPVRTGRFQRSYRLLVNGEDVEWDVKKIKDGSEVIITNVQPYARKLEVRAADGILESVGQAMKRRFGGFAKITFMYINLSPPVWITEKGKPVPHPCIRIAAANAFETARAARHSRGRRR